MQQTSAKRASKQCQGKVAIITGGTSGIGRAIAAELARGGTIVIITGRHAAKTDRVATEPETLTKGRIAGRAVEVRDATAMKHLVDTTVAEEGRLDFMFNNAGAGLIGEVRDLRP